MSWIRTTLPQFRTYLIDIVEQYANLDDFRKLPIRRYMYLVNKLTQDFMIFLGLG